MPRRKRKRKARRNTSWKQAERRIASFFKCKRTILSGASAYVRVRETGADTDHSQFFIEIKQRQRHGVWAVYRKTKDASISEAKRTKSPPKIPVIALDEIRAKGALICVHTDDLRSFCKLFLNASKKKSA